MLRSTLVVVVVFQGPLHPILHSDRVFIGGVDNRRTKHGFRAGPEILMLRHILSVDNGLRFRGLLRHHQFVDLRLEDSRPTFVQVLWGQLHVVRQTSVDL